MNINLELYRVFYYVATYLSFSQASKQLFISQSAVSQAVKSLEEKLGCALFIRNTKRVSLTAQGELLLSRISPAIFLISKGEEEVSRPDTLYGQLRIGASDTICRYFLVPYLQRFHREYPNVSIQVTNRTSYDCVELLERQQADLILVNSPNSRISKIKHQFMVSEFQDVFVANPKFFPEINRKLSLEEINRYPLMALNKKSTTAQFLQEIFEQKKLSFFPSIELSSNDLLIDFAKIGLGIALVPDFMLSANLEAQSSLLALQLDFSLPTRALKLCFQENPANQWVIDAFIRYFRPTKD